MTNINIHELNAWAKEHIIDDNMFDDDGCLITENKSDFRTTGIIAEILEQSWDSFYSKYKEQLDKIRPNCNKEINKIIKCHNHDLGATVYYCEEDNEVYFCHHTCKGKLCSHCGIKSQKTKVLNIMSKCINTNHRHITFTIPEDLRIWFRDDLYITNILYESVCDTIYSIVNGKVSLKRKYDLKYMPGFFSFLHTFGRDLKFNPHIHVIFCEGLLDRNNNFKKINYLNYDALSKRFMKILLDKMETFFGKDKFYQTKRNMYKKYPNGFYVNNKLEDNGITFHNYKDLISYVTRYCSRPAIAESRITSYDDENVNWYYIDHKDNKKYNVSEKIFDFIKRILMHLLPSNFKTIRYYGFYNKNDKINEEIFNKLISSEQKEHIAKNLKWNTLCLLSFKRIPIQCPKCNNLMKALYTVT